MAERKITRAEVEVVVANPSAGSSTRLPGIAANIFGYTSNGRPLNVVTNRAPTVVITLVLQ